MNSAPGASELTTEGSSVGRTPTTHAVDIEEWLKLDSTSLSDDANPSGRGFRVVIRGGIDTETAPQLAAALNGLIDEGPTLVLLDASAVGR